MTEIRKATLPGRRPNRPIAAAEAIARIAVSGSRWALLLDVDGTLLDIALRPELVAVPDGLVASLSELHSKLDGALAIVSGRRVSEIDRLLYPLELIAAGVHGTEWRIVPGGSISSLDNRPAPKLLEEVRRLEEYYPGVVVERKGAGVAIHFRLRPEAGPAVQEFVEVALQRHDQTYQIARGRLVIELLPAGHSKLRAFSQLLQAEAFAGRHPIWIGDDRSDEACFPLVAKRGGLALAVCGEHFPATLSTFAAPADVRGWLQDLVSVIP